MSRFGRRRFLGGAAIGIAGLGLIAAGAGALAARYNPISASAVVLHDGPVDGIEGKVTYTHYNGSRFFGNDYGETVWDDNKGMVLKIKDYHSSNFGGLSLEEAIVEASGKRYSFIEDASGFRYIDDKNMTFEGSSHDEVEKAIIGAARNKLRILGQNYSRIINLVKAEAAKQVAPEIQLVP